MVAKTKRNLDAHFLLAMACRNGVFGFISRMDRVKTILIAFLESSFYYSRFSLCGEKCFATERNLDTRFLLATAEMFCNGEKSRYTLLACDGRNVLQRREI